MGSDRSPELLVVAVRYISVYVSAIGPAVESATGLDTLSTAPGGLGRAWALIPNPQGWPLCVGYLPGPLRVPVRSRPTHGPVDRRLLERVLPDSTPR